MMLLYWCEVLGLCTTLSWLSWTVISHIISGRESEYANTIRSFLLIINVIHCVITNTNNRLEARQREPLPCGGLRGLSHCNCRQFSIISRESAQWRVWLDPDAIIVVLRITPTNMYAVCKVLQGNN